MCCYYDVDAAVVLRITVSFGGNDFPVVACPEGVRRLSRFFPRLLAFSIQFTSSHMAYQISIKSKSRIRIPLTPRSPDPVQMTSLSKSGGRGRPSHPGTGGKPRPPRPPPRPGNGPSPLPPPPPPTPPPGVGSPPGIPPGCRAVQVELQKAKAWNRDITL
jgi:hypothetical protein